MWTTPCARFWHLANSQFDNYLTQLSQWSLSNHMEVNERKSKEMIISASSSVIEMSVQLELLQKRVLRIIMVALILIVILMPLTVQS